MDTIAIQTQRPMMEIKIQNAEINIKNNLPELKLQKSGLEMKIKQEAPTFELVRGGSKFDDSMPAVLQISRQFINDALQKTIEYIAKLDNESGSPVNLLQSVDETKLSATNNSVIPKPQDVVKGLIEGGTKLVWDPGSFEIEWVEGAPRLGWEFNGPEITVEPYSVEVIIHNRPIVRISVVEDGVKDLVGSNINELA